MPREKVMSMASSQRQHRAHPPLIPEFQSFQTSTVAPSQPHKILDKRSVSGGVCGSKNDSNDDNNLDFMRFGIYHTKEQFVELALQVQHPFDKFETVDDFSRKNLFDLLTNGPVRTSRDRLKKLLEVESLAKQLAGDEQKLHQSLPRHVGEVLRGKNILLWERLLQTYKHPDMDVVQFMKGGVDLVGEHTTSPIYPEQRVGATTSVELLKNSAVWRNQSFAATPVHVQEPKLTAKLWEVTMGEVEKGFLKGPFSTLDEVRRVTGAGEIVVNRRFLLLQGEASKPRAIDDCKTSGLNSAYVQSNKLVLQDLDGFVALCSFAGRCVRGRHVEVKLSNGYILSGKLSSDFNGLQNILFPRVCRLELAAVFMLSIVLASPLGFLCRKFWVAF